MDLIRKEFASSSKWLYFLVGPIMALMVSVMQNRLLVGAWAHCEGLPRAIALDFYPKGAIYIGLVGLTIRWVFYALIFDVGLLGGNAIMRKLTLSKWIPLGLVFALLLCGVCFVLEFSLMSRLGPGTYKDFNSYFDPGICPSGYLPGWPLKLG